MRIWIALLGAPCLALFDQSVAYATAGWACAHQDMVALHAIHAFTFLAIAAGTVVTWRFWRLTGPESESLDTVASRHFLAGLGVAVGAISAFAVLAMWVPNWMLSPCFG